MNGILFWLFAGLIVYTYAGYPVLLTLLARLRRQPPAPRTDAGDLPTITLVITAYNEQAAIKRKLENSLALDYPRERLHILVVDDGSQDRTAEIVRAYAGQGVELVSEPPRRGKLAAINRAMRHVGGDLVLFSDANNLYDPQVLRTMARAFADPRVGGASGAKRMLASDDSLGASEGLYWKYESFIKRQETRLGSCTSASGDLFAMRRALYQAPPDNIINEDFYLALSVIARGYRVVYVPAAHSYDSISDSAQGEIERRARIVAGRYQMLAAAPALLSLKRPLIAWQVVSHKFLRPLVPLAMAGAFITNVLAVMLPDSRRGSWLTLGAPFNAVLLVAQLAFYAAALAGNVWHFSGALGKLVYLPTFLLNSNFAAVIGLVRFVTGRQSVRWERVRRREENPL